MINSYFKKTKETFFELNHFEKFLITFPVFAIIGTFALNLFYLILAVLFIHSLKSTENRNLYKKYFLLCFFPFLIILISYLFSDYKNSLSLTRTIFSFKFFLIPLIFLVFVKNKNFFYLIGQLSYFLLIFLSADVIFQYIFGFDFFGFKPVFPNRYSGFFDEELIAGAYLSTFFLFAAIYSFFKFNLIKFIPFFILIFFAVLITGERLALLKIIYLSSFIILFLIKGFKNKLIIVSIFLLTISISFYKIQSFKTRIYESLFFFGNTQITKFDKSYKNVESKTFLDSPWVSHWMAAAEIFSDHPVLGVGIKNFRVVCLKEKYAKKNSISNNSCTTHPHNIYMEIVSELGTVGLFTLFFYVYLLFRKIILLYKKLNDPSISLFIAYNIFLLIPFLPSGSIFSSYYGGILFFFISSSLAYFKQIK